MTWISLYRHTQKNTDIRVVSCCHYYRKLAKTLPTQQDHVLEIGCANGLATAVLAKSANQILAIDHSITLIEALKAQSSIPSNVKYEHIDARDISAIKLMMAEPDLIFIDMGGDAPVTNLLSVLRLYLQQFTPRQFIIRNFELAIIHSLISESELPEENQQVKRVLHRAHKPVDDLIELSHSSILNDRIFAARKLRTLNDPAAKQRIADMLNDPSKKIQRICGGDLFKNKQ